MTTIAASISRRFVSSQVIAHLRRWWMPWLFTVVLTVWILYPLAMLFFASFRGADGAVSLAGYQKVFSSADTYSVVWTTFWLAGARVALASLIGISLAWVVTRTDTPWRGGIEVLVWIGFFSPPLPIVVAWTMLAGKVGIFNSLISELGLASGPVFNIYSYWGIIWVGSLHQSALIFLLTAPAFRTMDANLEEAARMCGAKRLQTLFKITIPAVLPAVLGAMFYAFILAIESFETEVLLGAPSRIYVLTTKIYNLVQGFPQDMPGAIILSSFILLAVTLMILVQMKLLSGRSFVTMSGRGFAARVTPLGRWRWVSFALCLLYFFTSTVMPLSVLVAGSFMKGWGIWDSKNLTLSMWTSFFADPRLTGAISNTVTLGITVGLGGTLLCTVIGYIMIRTGFPGRLLLEFVTWAPRTAPAIVLAVAFLWTYVSGTTLFHPILGTVWMLAVVLMVNGIPMGSRALNGAMHQIGAELEQAARISGASWTTSLRHVLLPLLSPALATSFVLLFLLATRNLVLVMFFYTPDSRVLSTVLWESWNGFTLERALVAGVVMMMINSVALAVALYLRKRTGVAGF